MVRLHGEKRTLNAAYLSQTTTDQQSALQFKEIFYYENYTPHTNQAVALSHCYHMHRLKLLFYSI